MSESLIDFDKDFTKYKQNYTLIGIHVSNSQLSLFTGEQLGLKV
jgi:hypothetical protein